MQKGWKCKERLSVWLLLTGFPLFLAIGAGKVAPAHGGDRQAAADEKGAPKIQVDRDFIDYGDVPLEQMVEYRLAIKNIGTAPLIIENCHEGIIHTKVLEGC